MGAPLLLAMAALLGSRQAAVAASLQCTSQWEQISKQHQTGALSRQAFMASCLSGAPPPSLPIVDAPANAPFGSSYRCRDGMYAASAQACASHHGVAAQLR